MKIEYIIGIVLLILVAVAGVVIVTAKPTTNPLTAATDTRTLQKTKPFVEISNPAGFVNTDDKSIKIADYIGKKVILLDVMTYSCINCQRTFPYVTAWYNKYKDDGLIVIGIHTPEFAFEKNKENVEKAMREFGITFPVVLDNDYGTWNALHEQYWPHKYLIDIHGAIVYDHAGEGNYVETEMKIQELLKERATVLGEKNEQDGTLATASLTEKTVSARSPETYFGSLRNELLANGAPGTLGEQTLTVPQTLNLNKLYLGGTWNFISESVEAKEGALVKYRYSAGEVYLVAESETEATMEVWQDGKRVTAEAGADAPGGIVTIKASRLYTIIKNPEPGEHTLELKVSPGVKLFAFTFG